MAIINFADGKATRQYTIEELQDQAALAELGVVGKIPVEELLASAREYQKKVETELAGKMPEFDHNYWWNSSPTMKVEMKPTRVGFGEALREGGADPRVCCLGLQQYPCSKGV
ncbi:MAG: hypothetical protein LAO20_09985 [Acidobacteriia bacterium]|nr:hypothetical protein [Terriglobia bacterium]